MKIYNTLTGKKEAFTPIVANEIRIYVCGITVYDYCHIGHARSIIIFDIVVKYLRQRGFKVTYVHNITDVDDKIIKRAHENGQTCDELTTQFIDAMHEDEHRLGIAKPDFEPRATGYIPQIISLIEKLIEKKAAYVTDNGDVCFAIDEFKEYGKLSGRDVEKLISGARVHINDAKKNPLDFVLWKPSKLGEPTWDSPWGSGRPGWHIECSAMASDILGQPFDIHGGGMDLKFPHHENEIAQSEAACGAQFANTWMHVGLLNVNGEKMSKSLGNFLTIRDCLADHHPEVLRYFMISGHYRSPVNYSEDNLHQVRTSLERLYMAIRDLEPIENNDYSDYETRFNAVMDEDFNTPEALAVLFEMVHDIHHARLDNDLDKAAKIAFHLIRLANIFGILLESPEEFLQGDKDIDPEKVQQLIDQRIAARRDKNWSEADRLRDEIDALGVVVEDSAGKTTWRKK